MRFCKKAGILSLAAGSGVAALAAPLPPGLGFQQHIQLVGHLPGGQLTTAVGAARYDPAVTNTAVLEDPRTGMSADAWVSGGAARFELVGGHDPCVVGQPGTTVCPRSTTYPVNATIVMSDMISLQGRNSGQTYLTVHFSGSVIGHPRDGDDRANAVFGEAGVRVAFNLLNRTNGGGFGDRLELLSSGLLDPGGLCLPNNADLSCSASINMDKSYALNWSGDYSQWIIQATVTGYASGTWEALFGDTVSFGVRTVPDVGVTSVSGSLPVSVVPEPASALLLGLGLASLALRRRS